MPADSDFCEKIDSENCPSSVTTKNDLNLEVAGSEWKTADEYFKTALNEAIEKMDLIISMGLTALTVLIFMLGYYCINKARREGPLIAKVSNIFFFAKTFIYFFFNFLQDERIGTSFDG